MILKDKCPVKNCNKIQKEVSRKQAGKYYIIKLECGHTISLNATEIKKDQIISLDGKELYPFQYEGIQKCESSGLRFLFADEMGLGKANPIDSLLITPNGYKKMGDISIGDKVIGEDGKAHKVIGVYPQGNKEVFKVTFSDDSTAECCDEHLWSVNTALRKYRKQPNIIKQLSEIRNDLRTTSDNNKWYIQITQPVEFNEQKLPINPYALGLLIGDGCITVKHQVSFSTRDWELAVSLSNGIEALGCTLTQKDDLDFRVNRNYNLVKALEDLGLKGKGSKEKFIPKIYKFNSVENRLAILQGLMDTDGSIWNNGVIEYSTISERLAEDVKFLVQSLGGIVKTSIKEEPKYQYKGETLIGQRCFRLVINLNINPFRLYRKASQWKPNIKYNPTRAIVKVESIGEKECQCIKVDNPSQLYLMEEFTVTHNTPQILGTLKRHPEAFPVIILVKAALKHQWAKECIRWMGKEHLPIILHTSKDTIYNISDTFIIGLDLLKNLDLEAIINEIQPRTVVIDECQLIKNRESQRCKAVQKLVSGKLAIKRVDNPSLDKRKIVETIAIDLMTYHSVIKNFTLNFEELPENKLGLTECHVEGEGIIKGKITISRHHAENDKLDDVIETILHEIAHAITPGAGHRPIWRETAMSIGSNGEQFAWCNGSQEPVKQFEKPKYLLAASGTPIKNHAAEYFPILNMLRPNKFPSYDQFCKEYVGGQQTAYGLKPGGIRSSMIATFQEMTKEFIIRRERVDVMPELPLINRTFNHIEMGEIVEKMYESTLKQFQAAYDEMESEGGWGNSELRTNVLAYITRMRHIVGVAKVEPLIDYVSEFLFDTNRKLCIFVHHKDVGRMVHEQLSKLCVEGGFNAPLMFTSDLDSHQREAVKNAFINDPKNRIAILSTLSSGEGLDGLQKVCSDMIMLERQWNPANEEQVEGRFSRIGYNEAVNQINATYFLATGTIDEFFANIVENKRAIVKGTLNGTELSWHEDSLMRELAEILSKKKWSMKR